MVKIICKKEDKVTQIIIIKDLRNIEMRNYDDKCVLITAGINIYKIFVSEIDECTISWPGEFTVPEHVTVGKTSVSNIMNVLSTSFIWRW